jgi:hypothetical protein
MGLFGDLIGTLFDMSKLSKLTAALEPEIEALKSSGKCPDELAQGFEAIKNMKGDGSATDAAKQLEGFVRTLEQYSDLFSDDLKSKLPELMKVAEDLEKKAEDMESKTSN